MVQNVITVLRQRRAKYQAIEPNPFEPHLRDLAERLARINFEIRGAKATLRSLRKQRLHTLMAMDRATYPSFGLAIEAAALSLAIEAAAEDTGPPAAVPLVLTGQGDYQRGYTPPPPNPSRAAAIRTGGAS